MSDLTEIKQRIYIEKRIEDVLTFLGCWGIDTEQRGNLYVAGLPDGDNKRSVQVKNNPFLTANIRSKGIDGSIFDIISYILYEADTEEKFKAALPKSKFWLCNKLNYPEYIDEFYRETSDKQTLSPQQNQWLMNFRKARSKENFTQENTVYPINVLDTYGKIPYKMWLEEGISYRTQLEYGVGIDVKSDRITFPIHNRKGELVGVKGRYCGKDRNVEDNYKYLYILPCNKSIEFFNYHRAIHHIKSKNEVIIVEGGKTTMLLHQWGYRNCISIEGDSLSDYQIQILKELGLSMRYIFAFDKDKDVNFVVKESSKLPGRIKYGVYDIENLLNHKDSPTDKGKDVWDKLYKECQFKLK